MEFDLTEKKQAWLDVEFRNNPYPSSDLISVLAHEIDFDEHQVKLWFKQQRKLSFQPSPLPLNDSVELALQEYCKKSLCFTLREHFSDLSTCGLVHPVFMRATGCPKSMFAIAQTTKNIDTILSKYMEETRNHEVQPICPICTRSMFEVYASRLANGLKPRRFEVYKSDRTNVRLCGNCFERRRNELVDTDDQANAADLIQKACSQLHSVVDWECYRYERLHRFYVCHGFTGIAEIDQAFGFGGRKKRKVHMPQASRKHAIMQEIPGGFLCEGLGAPVHLNWDVELPTLSIEQF